MFYVSCLKMKHQKYSVPQTPTLILDFDYVPLSIFFYFQYFKLCYDTKDYLIICERTDKA